MGRFEISSFCGSFQRSGISRFMPGNSTIWTVSGISQTIFRILSMGATRRTRISLKPLVQFDTLRELSLEGQRQDIDVISDLTCLESLTLRSTSLPDLGILVPLQQLRRLAIRLGGTKDLGLLPQIGRLEYFGASDDRGLTDISAVGSLPTLQRLLLVSLSRVERLPSFIRPSRCAESAWKPSRAFGTFRR